MSLKIIVSGLTNEEVSFIRDASSLFWGEGLVEIKEYALDDLNLVKDLRLQVKDTSLVGVFLASFSTIPALEATRSLLESEDKFFEVRSTKLLVEYLNDKLGTDFSYSAKDEVSSKEPTFDESHYLGLLESKEGTIKNLQAQLEEYKLQFTNNVVIDDSLDLGLEVVSETQTTSEDAELLLKVSKLTEEVERLKGELSESKSQTSSYIGLSNSKDTQIEELVERHKQDMSSLRSQYESKLAEKEELLDKSSKDYKELKLEYDKISSKPVVSEDSTAMLESYKAEIKKLKEDLDSEKLNVINLNRKLISNNYSVTNSQNEDFSIPPVSSFFEVVTGDLFVGLPKLRNTEFIFAGSGDSIREGYLYAEEVLKRAGGGVILDLSTESSLDYRFGIRKGYEVYPWFSDDPANIKKYLSKTKYGNVYALGTFKGSFNELYLASLNLNPYLQYLDSLGTKIIIFGGSTSSFMGRKLCSSALSVTSVDVVCRSLGTSVRTMYFNSKATLGGTKAKYLLMGKVDSMSQKVSSIAQKEGYDWRFLDA
jgi:hypothetical protein